MSRGGWIGVDLDGTLAMAVDGNRQYGASYIGAPVPAMLARVHGWLQEGRDVRIVTARVAGTNASDLVAEARLAIDAWCLTHLLRTLPVTAEKDYQMVELWDDRAVQVVPNTGEKATDHAIRLEQDRLTELAMECRGGPGAPHYTMGQPPVEMWPAGFVLPVLKRLLEGQR